MGKTKQDWKCLFDFHQWSKWQEARLIYHTRYCKNCGAEQHSSRDLKFLNRTTKGKV